VLPTPRGSLHSESRVDAAEQPACSIDDAMKMIGPAAGARRARRANVSRNERKTPCKHP